MIALLHLLALAGYLGSWAMLWRAFREGGGDLEPVALRVGAAAALVHLVALGVFTWQFGDLPLVGFGPASSTLGLAVAGLTLAVCRRRELRPAALFVFPLVVLLLAAAVAVGIQPTPQQTGFRGVWFVAHVAGVFLGFAGLVLAAAAAAMYALQFRSLKRKEFGSVFSFFPSLDALDWLNGWGLKVGLAALAIGLVLGWGWNFTYGGEFPQLGTKEAVGVATLGVFSLAGLVRLHPAGRGERSAVASLMAFAVAAGVFIVLRILAGGTGFFL